MVLEKMRSCLWKLQLGFWTYGLIRFLGPSGPNVVLGPKPQDQELFWDFLILLSLSNDSWENEALFVKIAARILDLWFNTFSGPKWPKCSFWVLNPRSRHFWDFMILLNLAHDSWENEALFVKIAARILDLWFNMFSGPKCQEIFWDFMILLNSSHDSWENEALFVKIAARILDVWFNTFSGLKWPKCSSRVLSPKVKTF